MANTLISKGKLFWKKEWYSICSMHYLYNRNCELCRTGHWRNTWLAFIETFFYKVTPKLWMWWVNRPSAKVRWGKFEKYKNPDFKN
jgi:hypothetical protein